MATENENDDLPPEIRDAVEHTVALICEVRDPINRIGGVGGAAFIAAVLYEEVRVGAQWRATYHVVIPWHCVQEMQKSELYLRVKHKDGQYRFLKVNQDIAWHKPDSELDPDADVAVASINAEKYKEYGVLFVPDGAMKDGADIRIGDYLIAVGRDPRQIHNLEASPVIRLGYVTKELDRRFVKYDDGDKEVDCFICDIQGEEGFSGAPVFIPYQDEAGDTVLACVGTVIAVQANGDCVVAPADRIKDALHHPDLETQRRTLDT